MADAGMFDFRVPPPILMISKLGLSGVIVVTNECGLNNGHVMAVEELP